MEECSGPPYRPQRHTGASMSNADGSARARQGDRICWIHNPKRARHSSPRPSPPTIHISVRTEQLHFLNQPQLGPSTVGPVGNSSLSSAALNPFSCRGGHQSNYHATTNRDRFGHFSFQENTKCKTLVYPKIESEALDPRSVSFSNLELLCSATLDLGPLNESPAGGCSCPKSKCVALYCDCFKAGRHCDPEKCTCLGCLNSYEESGKTGARTKAIQNLLTRNPRAFQTRHPATENKADQMSCSCVRSRCLLLYCTCFQRGRTCNGGCVCVDCQNVKGSEHRKQAVSSTLEKRPDAFRAKKTREIGSGCACKNNRCIRKYCECYRTKLFCSKNCSCVSCQNQEV